nr:MAG TPA: hypothetical protein [Caudoviricetes sp.]
MTLLFSNGSKPIRKDSNILKLVKRMVSVSIMPARPYTLIIENKKGFCKPFFNYATTTTCNTV